MPVAELERVSFLSAHARLGYSKLLKTLPVSFAFFRDPVDRTISAYWHLRNENPTKFEDPEFREVIEECKSRSVEEIVLDLNSVALQQLINVQTWYLSGPEFERRPASSGDATQRGTVGDKFRIVPGKKPTEIGSSDLSIAKEALSSLSMFGIVESMEESLQWLEARLGLDRQAVPQINRRMSKEARAPVSTRVRDRLGELNTFDRELYSFASNLFWDRLRQQESYGDGFRPFSVEAVPGAPFKEVERHVGDGFIGGGWYPREGDTIDPWCWNGFTPRAWIDVFMEIRTDLDVMLEVAHWLDWKVVERTKIFVNGVALPTQHVKRSNGGVLKARAPLDITGAGKWLVRIAVSLGGIKVPSELSQDSNDNRELCFALRRYTVKPV